MITGIYVSLIRSLCEPVLCFLIIFRDTKSMIVYFSFFQIKREIEAEKLKRKKKKRKKEFFSFSSFFSSPFICSLFSFSFFFFSKKSYRPLCCPFFSSRSFFCFLLNKPNFLDFASRISLFDIILFCLFFFSFLFCFRYFIDLSNKPNFLDAGGDFAFAAFNNHFIACS